MTIENSRALKFIQVQAQDTLTLRLHWAKDFCQALNRVVIVGMGER